LNKRTLPKHENSYAACDEGGIAIFVLWYFIASPPDFVMTFSS
jgi:hypothetical protein